MNFTTCPLACSEAPSYGFWRSGRIVHRSIVFWPDPIRPVTLRTRPDPSRLPTLRRRPKI